MRKIETIIVLAAGDSSRFWPLKNKLFFPFLGKSLLEYQLLELSKWGNKLIVVVNDAAKSDVEALIGSISGSDIECVVQKNLDEGQAGALLAVKGKVTGEALIVNANDVFNFEIIQKIADATDGQKKDLLFLAKKVTSYFPGGYVAFANDKVTGIVEKPAPDKAPSDIVKLVVDYVGDFEKLIAALENSRSDNDDWYEKGLSSLISNSESVDYLLYEDYWHALKYPWHILGINEYFLAKVGAMHKGQNVEISPTAIIQGSVHIGDNVKIGDYAKIIGPCYIGDNVIVGDFAMIRSSHVGNGSLIGGYCEVARSYLGENTMLHRDYVGDSVFGNNVLMGADAVTANFRFDQKNVVSMVKGNKVDTNQKKLGAIVGNGAKIGIHTTITPGVKIGQNTFIGPHTLLDSDIEDNIFFYKGEKKENKS